MNISDMIKSVTSGKSDTRTAAELQTALAAIDITALEAGVTEIERRRRELLLTGSDEELNAITLELGKANLLAERAQALADALAKQLIPAAMAREKGEAIEAGAVKARAARERLFSLYERADDAAKAVVKVVAEIEAARAQIREANGLSGRNGRPELKVADPLFDVMQHVGCSNVEQLPQTAAWHLNGYTGSASERFQFGRVRELAPPHTRKAA
jgi:hypothetical protein